MASPLATEKVLRGTLQALQRGGVISSGSDVSKLESIPNNASDAAISAILDTIVFGGVAVATSVIRSDEDVNVFIDADDNDTPLTAPRYFRVTENQSDPPVTDDDHELMTVSKTVVSITEHASTLTIGPRTALAVANKSAALRIGTSLTNHYGTLFGSSSAVAGGVAGLSIRSVDQRIDLRADKTIFFADVAGNVVGGWEDPVSGSSFHVGDLAADESILLEPTVVSGTTHFAMRPSDSVGITTRRLYIGGSTAANDYNFNTIIGGKAGEAWAHPPTFGSPSLLVVSVGDAGSSTSNALYVYDRKTSRTGGEVATIRSVANPAGTYSLLRVIDHNGTALFSIKSTGAVAGPLGYTTGAADVAEVIQADHDYEAGTVLAIQQGVYTQTTAVAQSNVAGVVATHPGLLLGTQNDYDCSSEFKLTLLTQPEDEQHHLTVSGYVADRIGTHIRTDKGHFVEIEETVDEAGRARVYLKEALHLREGIQVYGGIVRRANVAKMAICGIVPVWCSTEGGDILGNGETLVSGPDGCAVVSTDPKPGTIIGKAQGVLIQPGTEIVKSKIEVLVNLQ